MPQKQPPASTAVSSPEPGPEFCADASAGGGIFTADSACAASGAAATAKARRRVRQIDIADIPRLDRWHRYTSARACAHHTILHVGVRRLLFRRRVIAGLVLLIPLELHNRMLRSRNPNWVPAFAGTNVLIRAMRRSDGLAREFPDSKVDR